MQEIRARKLYLALAVAAIVSGLLVHWHGGWMPESARDVIGDALWALMIASWVSAALPLLEPNVRYASALLLCFAVEFSQLWHTTSLDHVRATSVGHLVLGSGFDVRDFAAYALGVGVFAWTDRRWILRSGRVAS